MLVPPALDTPTTILALLKLVLVTLTVVTEETAPTGRETLIAGVAESEGVKLVLPPASGVEFTVPLVVVGVEDAGVVVAAAPPPPPPPPPPPEPYKQTP